MQNAKAKMTIKALVAGIALVAMTLLLASPT